MTLMTAPTPARSQNAEGEGPIEFGAGQAEHPSQQHHEEDSPWHRLGVPAQGGAATGLVDERRNLVEFAVGGHDGLRDAPD